MTIKMSQTLSFNINPGFCIHYHICVWWAGWDEITAGFLEWRSAVASSEGVGLLCVGWRGVLWMPPVHDPHTLYGIQHHQGPALISPLLSPLERWVMEKQTNTVVAHVCADIDCKLQQRISRTVSIRRRLCILGTHVNFCISSWSEMVF